jgi:tRNA CCA-adding enzyme
MNKKEKVNKILFEQLEKINLDEKTLEKVNKITQKFYLELEKKLKDKKINAEVFIGGSLAKKTLVKKDKYDVDIFVRFDKKYGNDKISILLENILGKNARKIHGSRDYFEIEDEGVLIEIIPVIKIRVPKDAENVTDLSYFHVNYVLNKIKKNPNLANEIKLAKVFCYSQDCYGAESYIKGFSGYSLELLICHFGGFLKFIEEISKNQNEKIIIDDSKFYKDKNEVLRELNEAKTQSPIILIDPTFKDRNTLAGLSEETFEKFRKKCRKFLKNPNLEFFKRKDIYEILKRKNQNLKVISVKTCKQKGDIAGTKSRKFFNYFMFKLRQEFEIKIAEFDYNENKNLAFFYLALDKKEDEIKRGPSTESDENLKKFKKVHPNSFIKNNIAYAKIKHNLGFEEFVREFLKDNQKIMEEMGIKEIKIVEE